MRVLWTILTGLLMVVFGFVWIWIMENVERFTNTDFYDKEPEDFPIDKD